MTAAGNPPVEVPMTPPPDMAGHALLTGGVTDANGGVVAGATIVVAETDGAAMTDVGGAYQLSVPSDSTVTLVTSATGFATTYRESVILAQESAAAGFDVLLLPPDQITALNSLAVTPDRAPTLGLMAVRLHSLNSNCATVGAHLTVWPPLAATVMYSRPSTSGSLDEPDPTVDGVQAGGHVDAWLVGVMVPGNQLTISLDQPHCQLLGSSPSLNGLVYPGLRRSDAQALTLIDLFLDQGP
jgi:hypothetical protein